MGAPLGPLSRSSTSWMDALGTLRSNLSITWPARRPLSAGAALPATRRGGFGTSDASAEPPPGAGRFGGPKHPDTPTLAISTNQQARLRTALPLKSGHF